ncbi:sulfite exporter TauE/SafE family protein [Rhodobacter ferrooxidans]|uniref:sulfite exporter TauE/SafE family protein n=1 Tax=Rhodobacter ferrooxidans TaxID=371731 RepID=UPI0002F33A42|nr:sulfite exporter TauE/SafE family protein [Rhodobacter sp. SW2]
MEGLGFWTLAVLASVLVGMSKGGLPVVGILGVPVLSLVISPVVAAGLLLPIYVVSDAFGLWAYRHAFNVRVLAILAPGMTLGVGFGWATASVVPEALVTVLIGVIGAVFALTLLLRRTVPAPREARVVPGLFWGMVTGFTSFVSHAGAPPYQVYVLPLRLEKAVFAGTSTIAFAYVNAVKLIPYYALGQLSVSNLKVAAVLALPAVLAVFAGVWLVRILPEKRFFQLVTWALLAVSLRLIWQGLA